MTSINQNILSGYARTISLQEVPGNDAAFQVIRSALTETEETIPIGISYHISETGKAEFICLANSLRAFIISDYSKSKPSAKKAFAALLRAGGEVPDDSPSSSNPVCLVGFGMAKIAIQVSQATSLRVKGVDLSTLSSPNIREPCPPSVFIADHVDKSVDRFAITRLWMCYEDSIKKDIVLQAWLAACAGIRCKAKLAEAVKLDTTHINAAERECLGRLVSQAELLDWYKPKEVPNDFDKGAMNRQGKYQIQNSRYKTRVRRGAQTQVILTDSSGHEFIGSARHVKGKSTTIAFQGKDHPSAALRHVKVVGRPDPTNPEKARDELIFLILAGQKDLRRSPFIRLVWFPRWKPLPTEPTTVDSQFADTIAGRMKLNESQRAAVHAMVGDVPVVVVHGPPGTGKTTTIAAVSRIWDLCSLPVWIVAHSNVAVKNIAETLHRKEVNFRLLISKEFYDEWHQHMYEEIEERLIRSDELPKQKFEMERIITNSKIVLCTLSMLSNPALHENGTFDIVTPARLIIDEASQISAFEYIHLFEKFQNTLEKVCFFGDPKQLPPYGQEKVSDMETIFDFEHLNQPEKTHFLNIQYRMPNPIATFISQFVYDHRLLSRHPIDRSDCLALINSSRTGEERAGFSNRNHGEIDTIVHLVKHYYRRLNFCVITPYDAQRATIQKRLEDEKLPWEMVYNVDSFQGNEADYVIVSVVRSSRAGFLISRNRMNVLLTRCRRGLIIVSSRSFLESGGQGSETLLGKLVAHWQRRYLPYKWIDWRSVAGAEANLPGVVAPNAPFFEPIPRSISTPSNIWHPFGVEPNSTLNAERRDSNVTVDSFNNTAFPPLISSLKEGWDAPARRPQAPHPLSFVHRRQKTVRNNNSTSPSGYITQSTGRVPLVSQPSPHYLANSTMPHSSRGKATQRPIVQVTSKIGREHQQPQKSKMSTKTFGAVEQQKSRERKTEIPTTQASSSFIRSITVYSRHVETMLPKTKTNRKQPL